MQSVEGKKRQRLRGKNGNIFLPSERDGFFAISIFGPWLKRGLYPEGIREEMWRISEHMYIKTQTLFCFSCSLFPKAKVLPLSL